MKKGLLFSLMLVFIFALCLTVTSCPEPNTIPAELVGKWGYNYYDLYDLEVFEFKSNGTLVTAGGGIGIAATFNISVSGNTVTVKSDGTTVGTFKYSIANGLMTITDATLIFTAYESLPPLKKL